VTLIVDAGAMFAQADRDDPAHQAVRAVMRGEIGRLVTSQVAVAEADYLILDRLGVDPWLESSPISIAPRSWQIA